MIKVIHVIPSLALGGAETMMAKLLLHSDRTQFSHTVVSMTTRGALTEELEHHGIPVVALGMPPGIPDPVGALKLYRLLRREAPQIVSTWLFHADLLGLLGAKMAGIPSVVWNVQCADLDPRDHPWHLRATLRALAGASTLPSVVIVNSSAGRVACERVGYHPRRWEMIPTGYDLNAFAPNDECRTDVRRAFNLSSDAPLVGLLARYHPMKDHATFLDAAAEVHGRRSDVHFLLAGRDVDARNDLLTDRIKALGLSDCVHLLGPLDRSAVTRLLAALDIACCSSYSEGMPNALGEAMACGVPCVSTDVGECAPLIGDTGAIVPPRDPSALALALLRVLDLPKEQRRALGSAARARIVALYDIASVAARYEVLFTELVAGESAGACATN